MIIYASVFPIILITFIIYFKNIKFDHPISLIVISYIIFFVLRYFYVQYKWSTGQLAHTYSFNIFLDHALIYCSYFFYIIIFFLFFLENLNKKKHINGFTIKVNNDQNVVKIILFLSFFAIVYFIFYKLIVNDELVLLPASTLGDSIPVDRWKGFYFFKIVASTSIIPFFYFLYLFYKEKKYLKYLCISTFGVIFYLLCLGVRGAYFDFAVILFIFGLMLGLRIFSKKIIFFSIFVLISFYYVTLKFYAVNDDFSYDKTFYFISLIYNRFYFLEYSSTILYKLNNELINYNLNFISNLFFNFLPEYFINYKKFEISKNLCVGVDNGINSYKVACTSFALFRYLYNGGLLGLLFFSIITFLVVYLWYAFYTTNILFYKTVYLFFFSKIIYFYTFSENNILYLSYMTIYILPFLVLRKHIIKNEK